MNPILFVGSHSYDLTALTVVAHRARERLGREVVFVTVAGGEAGVEARVQLATDGFPVLDRAPVAGARPARNPLRRARRWRDANLAIVDDLLATVEPAAIVSNVNPPPSLLLDTPATRGIPTVLLQLWFWGDRAFQEAWRADDRRMREAGLPLGRRLRNRVDEAAERMAGIRPHIVWDVRAATIAVQGPALGRRLVADGVAADRVVATGNPVLDDLHRLAGDDAAARRRVRAQLDVDADVPILSHFRNHEDRMLTLDASTRAESQAQILRGLAGGAPGARVVVKIHPKEGDAERRLIHGLDPSVTVVGPEVDTLDLIAASALTVGTFSTTLLQSVALDVPTVGAILWPGLDYWRRVTDWSGVDRVESEAALTEAVRRHLGDPGYQAEWRARRAAFRADELLLDGRGTERVVDLVESMIARTGRPA